jgi:hypothetical protein
VLLLDALEARDAALDLSGKRLDVAGRTADEAVETALDQRHEARVLGKNGRSSGALQVLCVIGTVDQYANNSGVWVGQQGAASDEPSLMLAMLGCWACDEIGAAFAGVFWGVLE